MLQGIPVISAYQWWDGKEEPENQLEACRAAALKYTTEQQKPERPCPTKVESGNGLLKVPLRFL